MERRWRYAAIPLSAPVALGLVVLVLAIIAIVAFRRKGTEAVQVEDVTRICEETEPQQAEMSTRTASAMDKRFYLRSVRRGFGGRAMKFSYALIALLLVSASLSITGASFDAANSIRNPEQSPTTTGFANWDAWHEYISSVPTPSVGCFEASYPNAIWQRTTCGLPISGHETPSETAATSTVGNANDFVAQSSATLVSSAIGTFPSVTGLKSEAYVCVPLFLDICHHPPPANFYSL